MDKKKEIGILRALGIKNKTIKNMVLNKPITKTFDLNLEQKYNSKCLKNVE